MKKLFKEFKEFICRGNIVDLAVAVIIGGAFSAIVTALTDKIIMPLVNWVLALCGGAEGLESAYTILSPAYQKDELGNVIVDSVTGQKVLDVANSIYIDWGAFIAAILNFLIIAFTIFTIVKVFNASKRKIESINNQLKTELNEDVVKEKKEVKKQAKAEKRKFSVVWAEHQEAKKVALEQAKAEEEAKKKAEEEANRKPTTEELLSDIKELLKKQAK